MALQQPSTALLPPFDPVTAFDSALSATAISSPSGNRASSGPGSIGLFSRQRSSSVHNTSSPTLSASFRHDAIHAPPVPSLPATPSTSSRPSSGQRWGTEPTAIDDMSYPPIKSVTVPHHSKTGKSWLFACRIVPESRPVPSAAGRDVLTSPLACSGTLRQSSLGRMAMAGRGEANAREPHTVWRTWSEFVDFSQRLSVAFPVVNSPEPSSPSALPSSFYRQTPRLSKKLTLFVTRATLVQRQQDLDLFTRRLFDMPDQVKNSSIVRNFFRLRDDDLTSSVSGRSVALPVLSNFAGEHVADDADADDGPESFSRFLAIANSPNATVKPMQRKHRPALIVKSSTPNLRHLAHDHVASEESLLPERPTAMRAATSDAGQLLRGSHYSVSTTSSASSTLTVTPQILSGTSSSAASFIAKKTSPLAADFRFGDGPQAIEKIVVEPKKRPILGPLRHFRSLQDLRSSNAPPSAPIEPVPKLPTARRMVRAVTQPHAILTCESPAASPLGSPLSMSSQPFPPSAYTGPSSQSLSRHRSTASKSSSTSSFEDLWGPPLPQHSPTSSIANATFRHGPSGRITRDPEPVPLPRARRPSMIQTRSASGSIGTKASLGHKSSASTSSIGSNRSRSSAGGSSMDMARSMSGYRSRRSSTDFSFSDAGAGGLSTPPTPHSESGSSSKYFMEHGLLAQNNKVPPPPFFPVPPPSSIKMDAAYSHDGMPHTPRHSRNPSLESRPRTSSTTSRRPLDTILASPKVSSAGSSPASQAPQDRPYLTFKLLHPEANLVLRVQRVDLSLQSLRSLIRDKFAAESCGVALENEEAHWGLAFNSPPSSTQSTQLIISEDDFQALLRQTTTLEKISLRVVV